MITLFQYQETAAATISDRFLKYLDNPPLAGTTKNPHKVPFFQALSALTGAGKTVVLAEAISQVASTMPVAPIVIWISRGKVVVRQSFANLSDGGKYHEFLKGSMVIPLAEYKPIVASDSSSALFCFATVGTFNQKDKEQGSLTIFQSDMDNIESSVWETLKVRTDSGGIQRSLFIVYDEAHNLSDQQTELLLELEPDGFLLASATMRLPQRLAREYDALKNAGWAEDDLITRIKTKDVVVAGLIKDTIDLAGYNAPMEETISKLLEEMKQAQTEADGLQTPFGLKAIYVCNTNVLANDAYVTDDPKQPFLQRQAPPILIWRYLVEQCKVSPRDVAVYADLKVDKDYPLDDGFMLYKGGDNDFERFTAAEHRHIIFNLSLQEGWDDPAVYFAYVDKSMDSKLQITQVIGRVLRQPNATTYTAERLNTAHFYVRVDRNEVFNDVVKEVEKELGGADAAMRIVTTPPGKAKPTEYLVKSQQDVPITALDGGDAQVSVQALVNGFPDYRKESDNTKGVGSRRVMKQKVGESTDPDGATQWEVFEQATRVSARWVLHRQVQRSFREALNVLNLKEEKFDAIIGVGSPAYIHVQDLAEKVVSTYVNDVRIMMRVSNPYSPQAILARPDEVALFNNALHAGYAGLNGLEFPFATALDNAGLPWCRNPSRIGYGIPLVAVGSTDNFYPDFLVWTKKRVVCIDTKGGHLVAEAAGRKLLLIRPRSDIKRSLDVQFVTEGRLNQDLQKESPEGFTQWGLNDMAQLKAQHFESLDELVAHLLKDRPAGTD